MIVSNWMWGWWPVNMNAPKIRTAVLSTTGSTDAAEKLRIVQRFIYANYTARLSEDGSQIVVEGVDHAGFTLDAIIDRLWSGNYFAREVTPASVPRGTDDD